MNRIIAVLLASSLLGCQTSSDDVALETAEIVGGTATTEFPAVPFLSVQWGGSGGGCSGTLVSPRVILTAAHCLDGEEAGPATSVMAYFGATVTGPDSSFVEEIPGEDWIFVPDWDFNGGDFGLILLEHDARAEPMIYNTTALGATHEGRALHLVGWGNTTEGSGAGTKRHVNATIQLVSSWLVEYGSPSANTCQGDSGGPGFLDIGGEERVVSVTSWGIEGCTSDSGAGRVDRAADWIADYIAANDVPIPPTVSVVSPADGDTVQPGFAVRVDATDNTRVERLELWLDGAMVAEIPTTTPPFVVTSPPRDDGPVMVEVRAYDNRGDSASAMVNVTVDSTCESSAECDGGFNCEDGVCVPAEGVTGDHCEANEDCLNGMCGTIDEDSLCTEQCTSADSCPDGFDCNGDGYCWPASDSGGCSVSGGSPSGSWLLLLLVVFRLRRGRRPAGR